MSTHCTITYKDGRTRTVKNLGWLLRNWQEVERIEVKALDKATGWNCLVVVRFNERSHIAKYVTPFADRDVLWDWLRRPVFFGVKLNWFGEEKTISKKSR